MVGGAVDVGKAPSADLAPGTERTWIVLDGSAAEEFQAALRGAVSEGTLVLNEGEPQSQSKSGARRNGAPADEWRTYYDNPQTALTLRGWWLSETNGSWLLRVPLVPPAVAGAQNMDVALKDLTDPAEILEVSGLTQHAELLRSGRVTQVSRLLQQAEVTPFARLRSESQSYRSADNLAPCTNQLFEVRRLQFDPSFAEAAAVSELLFSRGAGARSALQGLLVAVPADPDCAAGASSALAHAAMRLGTPVSANTAAPDAAAFIRGLRPLHLRLLRQARVPLTVEADE